MKVLRSKYENANYKYLFYALKNARIPDTGYNRHFKWLKEVKIEYPDCERQAEIVEILDKVALSELAEIKIAPFGSLLHKEDYIEGGNALLNPSHIIDGKVAPDNKATDGNSR